MAVVFQLEVVRAVPLEENVLHLNCNLGDARRVVHADGDLKLHLQELLLRGVVKECAHLLHVVRLERDGVRARESLLERRAVEHCEAVLGQRLETDDLVPQCPRLCNFRCFVSKRFAEFDGVDELLLIHVGRRRRQPLAGAPDGLEEVCGARNKVGVVGHLGHVERRRLLQLQPKRVLVKRGDCINELGDHDIHGGLEGEFRAGALDLLAVECELASLEKRLLQRIPVLRLHRRADVLDHLGLCKRRLACRSVEHILFRLFNCCRERASVDGVVVAALHQVARLEGGLNFSNNRIFSLDALDGLPSLGHIRGFQLDLRGAVEGALEHFNVPRVAPGLEVGCNFAALLDLRQLLSYFGGNVRFELDLVCLRDGVDKGIEALVGIFAIQALQHGRHALLLHDEITKLLGLGSVLHLE
eukprot:Opistho-2@2174